jgi:hypothetical protein
MIGSIEREGRIDDSTGNLPQMTLLPLLHRTLGKESGEESP